MTQLSVLITGAGAPGIAGTIACLRKNPDSRNFRIISTDIIPDAVGRHFSEGFYQVPPPESPEYISTMLRIIQHEHISVILPQTTRELLPLARAKAEFEKEKCQVVVSSPDSILKANDKFELIRVCREAGLPYPGYSLVRTKKSLEDAILSAGYPEKKVIVKPRDSSGLRGVRILSYEAPTLKTYLEEKPDGLHSDLPTFLKIFREHLEIPELLVTEYLPGPEYSVDVLKTQDGMICLPRLRKKIRSGITFESVTDLGQKEIIHQCEIISNLLDLQYCFGFQFKIDSHGVPKILESNPRVQGTMAASAGSGVNIIYYAVCAALGEKVPFQSFMPKDQVLFQRYWGGYSDEMNF